MDYIKIKGYKSIKEEKIRLKKINLLIGANGSGKSNLLSLFEFLNRLYDQKLNEYIQLHGGENKFLHKGKKNTAAISLKIEFNNGINGYEVLLTSGSEGFIFTQEILYFQGSGWDIHSAYKEAKVKDHNEGMRAGYIRYYLNGLRKYHFHDTSPNSAFTQLTNIENDVYYLYSDGSNLAAFLYNMKANNKIAYKLVIKTIQSIAPFFSDFYLHPNKENYVRLQWTDKFSDNIYGVNEFSDGTMRFIALTTLFMQPNLPNTIIIDEPELGLHPTAIAKLAGMIKSSSAKGSQVIIATQSTDLISHFTAEDVITVDQIDGASKFNRLSTEELSDWLEDYTIDDLWKRKIITTGQPNF